MVRSVQRSRTSQSFNQAARGSSSSGMVIALRCQDVVLEAGAHVRCTGKGRKTRCIPLRKEVFAALRRWLNERNGQPADAVFPNARGQSLSRDGVEYILSRHLNTAKAKCPTLKT